MLNLTKIYRTIFCRKGYGVHSPFVFDLITNVIGDTNAYYAYDDIALVRRQLLQNAVVIPYKGKRITVRKALRRYGISAQEGEFLFRLTNSYKPQTILSIGSSFGLAPLYLTRYDSTVQCITLESEPDIADIARSILSNGTNPFRPIITGAYQATLPDSIAQLRRIDCVLIGKDARVHEWDEVFEQCLPYIHESTFCVLADIRSSTEKQHYWTQFHQHPAISAAVDMYDLGLLFYNPKLQKRLYKTILMYKKYLCLM